MRPSISMYLFILYNFLYYYFILIIFILFHRDKENINILQNISNSPLNPKRKLFINDENNEIKCKKSI